MPRERFLIDICLVGSPTSVKYQTMKRREPFLLSQKLGVRWTIRKVERRQDPEEDSDDLRSRP